MVKLVDWDKCQEIFLKMGEIYSGDENDYSQNYYEKYISVFDHWLTEKEYIGTNNQFFSKTNIKAYYRKLLFFFSNLYEITEVYIIIRGDDSRPRMLSFKSKDEYLSYIHIGIQEELCIKLILPNENIIFLSETDFTWKIYCKDLLEKNKKLMRVVDENNLYLLELNSDK